MITGLNLVMGLIMGIVIHGMPAGQAFETYAILTVGDGLVTQIPAVVISVASALLLARGGTTGSVDVSFFKQLSQYPAAVGTVAVLLALFALVPGLPFMPFMVGAGALGWIAWVGANRPADLPRAPEALHEPASRKSMGDVLDFDEIHIEFAPNLVDMVLDPATGLDVRIQNMRTHIATTYGLILPEIRLTADALLPKGTYRIRLQGVERVRDRLIPERVLVLLSDGVTAPEGLDVREPVYGAPARWIQPDDQEDAALSGLTVVTAPEVLATHMLEELKANLARLLSLKNLRLLLDEFTNVSDPARATANKRLLDELIPDRVPVDMLLTVLKLLLEERVSIRNLPLVLEAMAEGRGLPTPEAVCEHVRQRLGFQIVADLKREDGTIPLLQLAPEWEKTFTTYQVEGERGLRDVALPPEQFGRLANALAERIHRAAETGTHAALVTSTARRRFLRTVLGAKGLPTPVLSYDEIGLEARPAMIGVVPA